MTCSLSKIEIILKSRVICFGSFIWWPNQHLLSGLSMSVFRVSGNVVVVTVCDLCRGGIVVVE